MFSIFDQALAATLMAVRQPVESFIQLETADDNVTSYADVRSLDGEIVLRVYARPLGPRPPSELYAAVLETLELRDDLQVLHHNETVRLSGHDGMLVVSVLEGDKAMFTYVFAEEGTAYTVSCAVKKDIRPVRVQARRCSELLDRFHPLSVR